MAAEASVKVSLRDIFGATEQDVARLQIISLHEVRQQSVSYNTMMQATAAL